MAKLTKVQRRDIANALSAVERAIGFIERPQTEVCFKSRINSQVPQGSEFRNGNVIETKHYTGREGATWSIDFVTTLEPVSKGIGSDLVAIYDARHSLQRMLEA
jgi:hypothetical protein